LLGGLSWSVEFIPRFWFTRGMNSALRSKIRHLPRLI
jgi:hypothetical protein